MTSSEATFDDDGNGAYHSNTISDEQATTINLLLEETGASKEVLLKYYGIERIEDLPAQKYAAAVKAIEKKAKK